MSWVFRHSLAILVALLLLSSCEKDYDQLPAQVVFIASLDLDDEQREKVLEDVLNSSDPRVQGWGNLLKARDLLVANRFIESLPYIEEAEIIFREFKWDSQGLARAMFLKSHVYWSLGAISEAILEFSNEAVALVNSTRWPTYAGNNSTYLLDLGYYEEALALSDTLLPIYKSNGSNLAEAYAVRLTAMKALGLQTEAVDSLTDLILKETRKQEVAVDRRHVYERLLDMDVMSEDDLIEALDFAMRHDFVHLEVRIRETLPMDAIPGGSLAENEQALRTAYQRSIAQSSSLNNEFLEYELDRSERLARRQQEQRQFRNRTYTLILGILFIAGLLVLLFFRNRIQIRRAQVSEKDAKLLLESYRNKIRPHFLFNQLNNVSGFLSQDKVIDAQEYIGLLSVHLRSLLEADKQERTLLGREFDRLENYIKLQQLSSYPDVQVSLECDSAVRFQRVPSGLLQPLVENSYKYAGNARQEDTYIIIRAYKQANTIVLEVEDSGFGFLERTPGTENGLTLIQERINFEKANAKDPGLWSVVLDFGKRKSIVKITMPFQHD